MLRGKRGSQGLGDARPEEAAKRRYGEAAGEKPGVKRVFNDSGNGKKNHLWLAKREGGVPTKHLGNHGPGGGRVYQKDGVYIYPDAEKRASACEIAEEAARP